MYRVNHYLLSSYSDIIFVLQTAGIFLSFVYYTFCVVFIALVVMRTKSYYGFYRTDLPPPGGALIDDRFAYPIWFLMLHLVRLLTVPVFVMELQKLNRTPLSNFIFSFFIFLLVLDLVIIVGLVAMNSMTCNLGVFRNSLCDHPNTTEYCQVHWKLQPNLCVPPKVVNHTAEQCKLQPNPIYIRLYIFTAIFLLLDVVVSLFIYMLTYEGPLAYMFYVLEDETGEHSETDNEQEKQKDTITETYGDERDSHQGMVSLDPVNENPNNFASPKTTSIFV